jgi:hypothetical protein
MPSLSAATIRYLLILAGIMLLGLLIVFGVHSCDVRHNRAAQSRVEASQAQSAAESASDAINTVSRSDEASRASEEQSRQAERDIRAAPGADQAVNPAVRDAGLRALCKRSTYANDPRCKRP